MRKNVWSSFTKKVIIAILLFGSIFSAGILGGYYLIWNNNNTESEKIEYITKPAKKIDGINGPDFYQAAPKNDPLFWLNDNEENTLINRIKNELGHGPEFYKLRSIIIGDENMTGEDANGVYLPTLNKIYINLENYKSIINQLKNKSIKGTRYTDAILSKIKIDLIFETIFHEYGHHIAFSYLANEGDFSQDQDKTIYANGKLANWNKHFVDKFKEYLNYSNWKGQKYNNKIQKYGYQKFEYRSIGSIYSQQDLFNHANAQQKYSFSEMDSPDKVPYLFAPESQFVNAVPITISKDKLTYYYSMDELFTRKYQQLNQIYKPVANIDTFLEGYYAYSKNNIGGSIVALSDILSNTLLYQNSFGDVVKNNLNQYELKNFKDYDPQNPLYQNTRIYNPEFKNPEISNRFLYDAPFNNNIYEHKDKNGATIVLQDHHEDLYNLMDNFLGHATGDDISIVWPKNSITTNGNKKAFLSNEDYNNANNLFKFGGYLRTNDYVSVGYKDQNNNYKELSKITINDFNYKHKSWLGATEYEPLDPNKENYFYTTNIFINKNQLLGKKLWFKKGNSSNGYTYEELKNVRNSLTTGTNRTWYSHFSDLLKIQQKYSFVLDNTNVIFKEIP